MRAGAFVNKPYMMEKIGVATYRVPETRQPPDTYLFNLICFLLHENLFDTRDSVYKPSFLPRRPKFEDKSLLS